MTILERLKADKEIQQLKKQLRETTGRNLPWNYDCYLSLDEYKEHLRECVKEGKIVVREKDRNAVQRFKLKEEI